MITVIPLLAETERASDYDRVLLVDCEERAQRERTLAQRDGSSAAMIKPRSAPGLRARHARAADDFIGVNDGARDARAAGARAARAVPGTGAETE